MKQKYFPYQCGLNLPGQIDVSLAHQSIAAKILSYFYLRREWTQTKDVLRDAHTLGNTVPLIQMSKQKFLRDVMVGPTGPIRVTNGSEKTFQISFQDNSALLCRDEDHSISTVPEILNTSYKGSLCDWFEHFHTPFTPGANMRLFAWQAGRFFVPLWCFQEATPDSNFLPTMNNIAKGLSLLLPKSAVVRVMPMHVQNGQPIWGENGVKTSVISDNSKKDSEQYANIIEHTLKGAFHDTLLHKGCFVSPKQQTPIFQFTTT